MQKNNLKGRKITNSQQIVVLSGSFKPFGEVEETVNSAEHTICSPGVYTIGQGSLSLILAMTFIYHL